MKQEVVQKQETKQSVNTKLALQSLQKQLQLIKLKEWLLMSGFAFGAAALRVPMQVFPSAEPISFFAILSGWLFGKKKGFLVGAGALVISNFLVFGGQGPWSIAQAFAFGLIGFLGGFLRKKSSILEVLAITLIGTLIWEIVMNFGSSIFFGFNIFLAFAAALPFTLIHLGTNLGFAFLLKPSKKLVETKGGLNEKELCNKLIRRIRGNRSADDNSKSATAGVSGG